MTDARRPDEDDLLAAELALGLLDAGERREAERREAADPAFARAVDWWRERATGLLAGADVPPPAWLWRSIVAGLPANDAGSAREVTRWRVATGVAAAAALVLGVLALRPATPPPAPPRPAPTIAPAPAPLVATLSGEANRAVVTVVVDRAANRLMLAAARLSVPGRSAQLWVIANGTPRALGLVDPASPTRLSPPPGTGVLLTTDATLAVSVEPVGGSPTGKPTGPVILTGVARAT